MRVQQAKLIQSTQLKSILTYEWLPEMMYEQNNNCNYKQRKINQEYENK